MGWWLDFFGDYINSAALGALVAEGSDTTWHIRPLWMDGTEGPILAGEYASQAAAQEAIRLLVHGVDASS